MDAISADIVEQRSLSGRAPATSAPARAGDRPDRSRPLVLLAPGSERFAAGVQGPVRRITVGHFANGELHLRLPVEVGGRDCTVIASVAPPPGNVERLTLIAHTLRRAGATSVTAVLPYLAYARQDIAPAGDSLGLMWLGDLLRASGVSSVVTVDVHSREAPELLGLPLRSLSPAALMVAGVGPQWLEDVTFVAPDAGARARCSAVATAAGCERPIVWARKRRTGTGVEHMGLEGVPGRRAIIVDDILDTGATLRSCCELLRAAGVEQLGVLVTHGLFTGSAWRALSSEVEMLWVTDTVLSRRRPADANVIQIAPLLSQALLPTRH